MVRQGRVASTRQPTTTVPRCLLAGGAGGQTVQVPDDDVGTGGLPGRCIRAASNSDRHADQQARPRSGRPPLPFSWLRNGASGLRVRHDFPIEDETRRFTLVKQPPAGKPRWTADDARRVLGRQVENPVSKQEKITAIHALAQDEAVAAVVSTDLLRRSAVSAHVAVEDRVRVVEEFTRNETVAATVTTGLL